MTNAVGLRWGNQLKIFVTGICGRLGRAIAFEANRNGHTIVGLDAQLWPTGQALPAGIDVIAGSYEDGDLVERLLPSCDALIHTAGPHGEQVGKLTLAEFLHSNVESVARLLETAARSGVRRAVLSSTMEILLGRDWTSSGATVVDEETAPKTDSPYSISRLLQEQLAREFSRSHGVSIASLRYMCFGYQPNDQLGTRLLARYLATIDAARAALRAASLDGFAGEVFHIGPKTPLTNQDIVQALSKPTEVLEKYFPGAMEVLDTRKAKLSSSAFWPVTSIRRARLGLGWEPSYAFEQWLLDNGWRRQL